MYEAEEIFGLIPEGYFDDAESFVDYVNNNGIEEFWDFMPEGYWDTKEDFLIGLKKKPEKDTVSVSEGGLSEQPTQPDVKVNAFAQTGEKDTLLERVVGKNDFTDFFGDLFRAGVQGSAQGATLDDALKVFSTGEDISTEDLNEYIAAVKNMDSYEASDEMKDFNRIYEQAGGGWGGFAKGLGNNLSVAPQLLASSIAAMINPTTALGAGTGAALGAGAGAVATSIFGPGALFGASAGAVSGAIGGMSGILEAGLSYTEFLREELEEKGLKFDDSGIRKVLGDEDAMNSIINKSLARGVSIAAIDALSGGLATMATKGVAKGIATGIGKTLATTTGVLVEGIGGSVGEATARALTGQEMDIAEIGFEGVAGTSTAPLTVARGLIQAPKYRIGKENVSRAGLLKTLKTATPKQIAAMDFGFKNDPVLESVVQQQKADAIIENNVMQAAPYLNEADKKASIKLEKDKQKLIGNNTVFAKKQISDINAQLNEIREKYNLKEKEDAIQESSPEGVVLREQARDGEGVGVKDSKPAEKITPQEETVAPTDQEITQEADVTELTEDEKLEKVTKEKVKKLVTAPRRITEPFKIGRTTITLNEDGTIKSAVNSKGVPVKEAALKRVQKKVLESLIDIDSGEKATVVEGITEQEAPGYIAENSNNVREIAETIQSEETRIKEANELAEKIKTEDEGLFSLTTLSFTPESWEAVNGNPPSENISSSKWIRTKEKGGLNLEDGVNGITPKEIERFILDNPTAADVTASTGEVTNKNDLISLQEKFKSLTGIAPTTSIVDFVVGIEQGRVPLDLLKALEKEQLTRQAAEPVVFGKKRGPSAKKITSTPKKEITVDEIKALKDQIRLEAKAAREAKGDQTARRKAISNAINALKVVGKINLAKAKSLINKISTVDLNKAIQVEKALAYVEKVFTTADYDAKLSEAESLRKSIKNLSKTEKLDVYPVEAAKRFLEIDPVLVEDIESYIEEAKKVKDGVTPSTKTKTMPALDIKKTDEYTTSEVNKQKKIKLEAEKEVFQELTGLSPDEFSLQDMREIVNGVEQDQPADVREKELESKAKTNADVIKKGLNKTFNTVSTIVNQLIEAETDPFTGEIIELTKEQKKLVKDFLNIDINKLSDADAVIALDSLINFATNKTTGGMGAIVRRSKGNLNSQTFLNLGYKAIPLSVITDKIKIAGIISRGWNEYISSLPLMLETMFKGQSKAAAFERLSGLSELKRGASDGVTITKEITDRYSKAFFKKNRFGYLKTKANGEDFNTAFNNIERDMFARLKRTIPGEEQVEFKRIKGLIEQSIDVLKEANLDEKAKLYEEVYDKILKDSDNISEVESKVDKTNAEAVGWMINEWSKFYPKLNELNVNIYNKILNKEVDYTPVTFSSIEKTEKISEIGEPILEFSLKKISDKKTGVLMEAKRPTQLPKGRYLNLNFDSNNILALEKAVIDLKTAGAIQQLKGFFNSKDFLEIVPSSNDRKILTDRVIELVEAKRGRNYINNDSKEILKSLNSYSLFGVSRTLGSVSQAVKQTVPVYINTIINAGPEYTLKATNMVSTNPDINKLINNSGYSIANRGIESITNLESINSKIESAASGNAEATVRAVNKLQSMWLQGFLVKPDRAIARLSWWAYYLKSLEKQGIDTSKVDWSSHKIDSKAGDYAQQQVDRQQNVSDIDLQGKVFRSKNPSIQFARKALLPFSNFLMNQKTRMYSDLTIVTSKTATKEDKIAAWKSLGGLAAETVTFNLLGLYIIQGLVLLSAENDEDAEEKLKRFNNRKKGRAGQALKDIISPLPLGIIDEPLVKGINTLIRVADSDDPYQFFEAQPKDAWDNLGLYSIPLTRFDEWLEMTNMAINGNYEVTGPFGKKTTKKLNGAGKGDMLGNWLGYTAYSAGFLPAEAGTIARNNVKYIKKNKTKK